MALITIARLSFTHHDGQKIFDQLSLQLDTNWKLGLIGRNGRGKTTFLKLLQGSCVGSGRIERPCGMDYFPFPVDNPQHDAFELARQLCPEAAPWQVEKESSLLDLSPAALTRPLAALSPGEATKLLLALLFLRENSFLLIDEPTNHLDLRARQVLGKYLRRKAGFILVSHDRSLLDTCVDHILALNRTDIELQRGNFSSWHTNRQRQNSQELAEQGSLKKELVRLEESARRSANWSDRTEKGKYGNGPVDRGFIGHKAAKMMQRAKAVEARRNRAAQDMRQLLHNVEEVRPLGMKFPKFHGKRLLELRSLALAYGEQPFVRDLSFSLEQGERLALCGKNGSGKSSLLKAICGELTACAGELSVPGDLRISRVVQDTGHLVGPLGRFAEEQGVGESLLRAVLHRLGLERGHFETDLAALSAGQKKKALLAASLCQEAHLYIWDEPLNYIDALSRLQVEEVLLEHQPSLIFVEHDQGFVDRVATRLLDMDNFTA